MFVYITFYRWPVCTQPVVQSITRSSGGTQVRSAQVRKRIGEEKWDIWLGGTGDGYRNKDFLEESSKKSLERIQG